MAVPCGLDGEAIEGESVGGVSTPARGISPPVIRV